MYIEDQIFALYEEGDEAIYNELNKLNKDDIYNLINYYNKHNLARYYELINFLYNYLEFNF